MEALRAILVVSFGLACNLYLAMAIRYKNDPLVVLPLVLESGTGSGSLTHSLARAVAPMGHVHTFDFHQKRVEDAAREFGLHGLGSFVTARHRNIEADGFPEELHGRADALFLDLPGPWNVRLPPKLLTD